MNGWVVALVVSVVAGVWLQWQGEAMAELRDTVALLNAELAAIEINRKYDDIDKELMDGGEDDLSPYMRGAGKRLWGTP